MVPFRQDLRIAARGLLRAPVFSATVILTIALAVGANTAVFTVTNAVLIRSLPFASADRLIWITSATRDQPNYPFSIPEFLDYREQARTLDALVAFTPWSVIVGASGTPERLQGVRISADAFDVLGVDPAAGRLLNARDDRAEASRVAVLAFDVWQRRFGGSEAVIGGTVLLNGEPHEIVGVLPRHFPISVAVDVAVPLAPDRDPARGNRRSVNLLRMIGRLRPGATREQAAAELAAIAARLRADHSDAYAAKLGVSVMGLQEYVVRNYARGLTLLTAASAVALLVACGNLVNLLLARATARASEVSVRLALGAGLRDVARALWFETLQLSALGTLLGVALASALVGGLTRFGPPGLPRLDELAVDWQVLVFAGTLMLLIASALALAPLWAIARWPAAFGPTTRDQQWSRRGTRLREAVVIGETALAAMLLLASVLLLQSFVRLQDVDTGFPVERRVMTRLALPRSAYKTPHSVAQFADRFDEELRRIPGVDAAGGINVAPLSGVLATVNLSVDGKDVRNPNDLPTAHYRVVTDGYLPAIGVPLLRGRRFSDRDTQSSAPVALVNQHLASLMFPGEEAIGRRIRIDDTGKEPRALEIVGIVGDVRQMTLDGPAGFDVYVPMRQAPENVVQWLANNQFWVVTVSDHAPRDIGSAIRKALQTVDPTAAVAHVRPLEMYIDGALAQRRFSVVLAAALAAIALALVVVGLYGVMAYSVTQRTREIGVRAAIGASRFDIWRLITQRAAGMLAAGVASGLVLAWLALQPLEALLFETERFEALLVAVVAAGLFAIGLLGASVPAWRAARIDPSRALRR